MTCKLRLLGFVILFFIAFAQSAVMTHSRPATAGTPADRPVHKTPVTIMSPSAAMIQLAEDIDAPSTPNWTLPGAFMGEEGTGGDLDWPVPTAEARPGAMWWWPGNTVTASDITWNMETYREAGWGTLTVIGIYGVKGEEDRYIDLFSEDWFDRYNHAIREGRRLGLNIDLTPSSGWRFGGPHVPQEHGDQNFVFADGEIGFRYNGERVKRASPGGHGLTINPFSEAATTLHFDWVNRGFRSHSGLAPRAFYYDSFENGGNWCPELPAAFRRHRGYRIEQHAADMAEEGRTEASRRVICDYRETLSELLVDRVKQIRAWGQTRDSGLRIQAHGAPANLLDVYAAGTIPETEVFGASRFDIPGFRRDREWVRSDPTSNLVNRFASSAAHIAGHPLTSSESFTWMRNHFHGTLSQVKPEADKLLLNGINSIFYHGTCFAPEQVSWPGWLFYASTQANARNSIFRDIPQLNTYITRCQGVLQAGAPHNDVMLYWPVYDLWMRPGSKHQRYTVHHTEWLVDTPCGEAGQWLMDQGYTFDFVSDQQLDDTRFADDRLVSSGGSKYRTILVPAAEHMPIETAQALIRLARSGATVLVWQQLPGDVPGFRRFEDRRDRLEALWRRVSPDEQGVAQVGNGRIMVHDNLDALLAAAADREPMADLGLQFLRRVTETHIAYFIVNHTDQAIDQWVPIASACQSALLMDPMTGRIGVAPSRDTDQGTDVYLQMQPGETRVLRVFESQAVEGSDWPVYETTREPVEVTGEWGLTFVEGGPALPEPITTQTLASWTELGDAEAQRFAGAARYTITIEVEEIDCDGWVLNLGDVRESARVWVNGEPVGIVIAHPFRVDIGDLLRPGKNTLAIEVTNLSANRIRDLDLRGVSWKIFHDINFVSHQYKPFDASGWDLKPSGLLGPVTLQPYDTGHPTR